jgi:hypothetical protein
MAKLEHAFILPVYDYGAANGYSYIVMRLIESGSLADLYQGKPLPLPQIQKVVTQVGGALDHAHALGICHRDVKPKNILIDPQGNCLLMDFGIAKILEATSFFTQTGGTIGTPTYMSPEQIRGEKLDGRSDLYSLGVALYEMATGRPPYEAETPSAIIAKHLRDPLPPPRLHNPALSEEMERVIVKAMAKDRGERFQTGGEMAKALTDAALGRPAARATPFEGQQRLPATELVYPPDGERAVADKEAMQPPRRAPVVPTWVFALGAIVVVGGLLAVIFGLGRPNGQDVTAGTSGSPGASPTATTVSALVEPAASVAVTEELPSTPTITPGPSRTPTATAVPTGAPTVTLAQTPTRRPTFSSTPIPQLRVVPSSVNVRSGPGTSFAVIMVVREGVTVSVLARNAESSWYNVRLGDGTIGWISSDVTEPVYLEAMPGIPVAATIPPSPTYTPAPTFTFTPTPVPTSAPIPPTDTPTYTPTENPTPLPTRPGTLTAGG